MVLVGRVDADTLAVGITEPIAAVSLSMPVGGQVEKLLVRQGTQVTAGDVLLILDREIEDIDRRSKRLIYEDRSAIDELSQRLVVLQKQVRAAQDLVASGSISVKQLQDEEIAWLTTKAQLVALKTAKARERLDLALAEETFQRRQLQAPTNGIVTRVDIEVGETLPAQQPVIEIVNAQRVRFRGNFSVEDRARFHEGDVAMLRVVQYGEVILREAKVTYVAPVADPSSGLIDIVAEIENSDLKLIPGTTADLLTP